MGAEELARFLKWVDGATYQQHGMRFWEDSNTFVTEEELAEYYLGAPDSPYNTQKQTP